MAVNIVKFIHDLEDSGIIKVNSGTTNKQILGLWQDVLTEDKKHFPGASAEGICEGCGVHLGEDDVVFCKRCL